MTISNTFETFNQFDSRFKEIGQFSKDCSACPFFSLITAFNFFQNGLTTKDQYENNLYDAISSYILLRPPKFIDFEELISYTTGINKKDILATTPELVFTDEIGWNCFFPQHIKKNYCTIFLKNTNFFIVLVKKDNEKDLYTVRDCHLKEQYNFDDISLLKTHLNTFYNLEKPTIIDGLPIPEFDNIEFLPIKSPFTINF